MLDIDLDRGRKFERELKKLNARALPFANRNFINDAAFAVMREYKSNAREELTLRNPWTLKSIGVDRSRTLDMRQQVARVGSVEEYMLDTEMGVTERKSGSKGVTLNTGWSAGQQGQQPRTRLPRRANAMKNIKLGKKRKAKGSRRAQNYNLIREAIDSGNRYIFMDLGKRQGIFKVVGGRKRKKPTGNLNRIKGAKVKMVHDMSHHTVTIPATPLLGPALETVRPKMPNMYTKRLIEQIRRTKLFRR